MKIHIINGLNMNLLGKREPDIYGKTSFQDYFSELQMRFRDIDLSYFHSNIEGEITQYLKPRLILNPLPSQ